jgi:hypothetical protein
MKTLSAKAKISGLMLIELSLLFFAAVSVRADTNIIAVLTTANGISYTNARIDRTTPIEAFVWYDGGITRVALTNLPESLKQKYPYDTNAAAQFLAAEKQKKQADTAAEQSRLQATQEHIASLAKNARWINIVDVRLVGTHAQYKAVLNGVQTAIYLNNAPTSLYPAVIQFAMDQRAAEGNYVNAALSGDGVGKSLALQSARDAADEKPMVKAYATETTYGGIPVWQSVGE